LGVCGPIDEPVEELGSLVLTALLSVIPLSFHDGEELRPGLEEPAPFADALEDAVE
jgi:hypothetical protein